MYVYGSLYLFKQPCKRQPFWPPLSFIYINCSWYHFAIVAIGIIICPSFFLLVPFIFVKIFSIPFCFMLPCIVVKKYRSSHPFFGNNGDIPSPPFGSTIHISITSPINPKGIVVDSYTPLGGITFIC